MFIPSPSEAIVYFIVYSHRDRCMVVVTVMMLMMMSDLYPSMCYNKEWCKMIVVVVTVMMMMMMMMSDLYPSVCCHKEWCKMVVVVVAMLMRMMSFDLLCVCVCVCDVGFICWCTLHGLAYNCCCTVLTFFVPFFYFIYSAPSSGIY